jgi:hypothetical protein
MARNNPTDPNTGVKVNEAKELVQFLKGNHTSGSRPTCGSRQTLHADPLPRDKGKDGRSLTSNVTPTPLIPPPPPYAKITQIRHVTTRA